MRVLELTATKKRALMVFTALSLFALMLLFGGLRRNVQGAFRRLGEFRAAKRVQEYCAGYEISETECSTVYFTARDRDYALAAQRIIKTYLPLLAADFGLASTPRVTLIIYPTKADMYASIGYVPPENGSEPMGAYSEGILSVLSPSVWVDNKASAPLDVFIADGPVIHELAHFMLDIKAKGNYPEWFSEGTAIYYEGKYTGKKKQARVSGKGPSYGELKTSFRYLDKNESYPRSHELVQSIAALKGEEGLKNIYGQLEKGKGLETALKKLLGEDFDALNKL